jgi:molecular chaperone GrpE
MEGHRDLDCTEENNSSRTADEMGNSPDGEDRASLLRERERKLKRSKTRKSTRLRSDDLEDELSEEDLMLIPQESDAEIIARKIPEEVLPPGELFPAETTESALALAAPPVPIPEYPKTPFTAPETSLSSTPPPPAAVAPSPSVAPSASSSPRPSEPPKVPLAPKTPASEPASPVTSAQDREKLDIGVEELINVIKGIPVLDFLNSRIVNAREKGLDYPSMLGFYRITSRMLKEEYEKKKDLIKKTENDFDDYKKRSEAIKGGIFGFMQPAGGAAPSSPLPSPPQAASVERIPEKPKPEIIDDTVEKELFLLRETVKQRESKLDEYMDMCERLKNDFNNFRNRAAMEIAHQVDRAAENLIVKFLPVLDNFERALKATSSTTDMKSLIQGIEMIHYQFEEVLRGSGVQQIKAQGEPFDPKIHEALAIEETEEHPDDTVLEEISRGYMLKTRILRPSLVKVAKNTAARLAPPIPAAENKAEENKAEENKAEENKAEEGQ